MNYAQYIQGDNMNSKHVYYYKIYDDKEQLNFFKSSLERENISQLLKEYESDHQKYMNSDFVEFLREHDPEAEFIEVSTITY
jgi:hypothetical protein